MSVVKKLLPVSIMICLFHSCAERPSSQEKKQESQYEGTLQKINPYLENKNVKISLKGNSELCLKNKEGVAEFAGCKDDFFRIERLEKEKKYYRIKNQDKCLSSKENNAYFVPCESDPENTSFIIDQNKIQTVKNSYCLSFKRIKGTYENFVGFKPCNENALKVYQLIEFGQIYPKIYFEKKIDPHLNNAHFLNIYDKDTDYSLRHAKNLLLIQIDDIPGNYDWNHNKYKTLFDIYETYPPSFQSATNLFTALYSRYSFEYYDNIKYEFTLGAPLFYILHKLGYKLSVFGDPSKYFKYNLAHALPESNEYEKNMALFGKESYLIDAIKDISTQGEKIKVTNELIDKIKEDIQLKEWDKQQNLYFIALDNVDTLMDLFSFLETKQLFNKLGIVVFTSSNEKNENKILFHLPDIGEKKVKKNTLAGFEDILPTLLQYLKVKINENKIHKKDRDIFGPDAFVGNSIYAKENNKSCIVKTVDKNTLVLLVEGENENIYAQFKSNPEISSLQITKIKNAQDELVFFDEKKENYKEMVEHFFKEKMKKCFPDHPTEIRYEK